MIRLTRKGLLKETTKTIKWNVQHDGAGELDARNGEGVRDGEGVGY